jgi:hypothetical protein
VIDKLQAYHLYEAKQHLADSWEELNRALSLDPGDDVAHLLMQTTRLIGDLRRTAATRELSADTAALAREIAQRMRETYDLDPRLVREELDDVHAHYDLGGMASLVVHHDEQDREDVDEAARLAFELLARR